LTTTTPSERELQYLYRTQKSVVTLDVDAVVVESTSDGASGGVLEEELVVSH
jgi:hypothetical protein